MGCSDLSPHQQLSRFIIFCYLALLALLCHSWHKPFPRTYLEVFITWPVPSMQLQPRQFSMHTSPVCNSNYPARFGFAVVPVMPLPPNFHAVPLTEWNANTGRHFKDGLWIFTCPSDCCASVECDLFLITTPNSVQFKHCQLACRQAIWYVCLWTCHWFVLRAWLYLSLQNQIRAVEKYNSLPSPRNTMLGEQQVQVSRPGQDHGQNVALHAKLSVKDHLLFLPNRP